MNAPRGLLRLSVLLILVAATGALALMTLVHRDHRATMGEELPYDDFGFRAGPAVSVLAVGPTNARLVADPRGQFVVVRLDVENHARRVDYGLASHVPRLEDDAEHAYAVDADATAAFRAGVRAPGDPQSIRPGMPWSSYIVFRVPRVSSGLRLCIGWREPIDGIDRFVMGDRAIALDLRGAHASGQGV